MDKLEKEAKEEEARKLKEFENYKSRAINEVRNRQAAELSSRNDMGAEESKRVSQMVFSLNIHALSYIVAYLMDWPF